MGTFVYTAQRSLIASHTVGEAYALEIGLQASPRRRHVEKNAVRSKGGKMEVLRHYADVQRSITFEPVNGVLLDQLREFLDSVEGGEQFSADLYGSSSALTIYKRSDDEYQEELFQEQGRIDLDYYQISVTIIEA